MRMSRQRIDGDLARLRKDMESLQHSVHDAIERIGDDGRRATDRMTKTVHEHPVAMLSAAFAVGAMLGIALRRSH
jgi:ElaB/YqjD/DUF883 family membrane-anchored ribosome-binding protein